MTLTAPAPEALQELQTGFRGELMQPDSGGYDDARRVFNAMIDRRPALIAHCSGVADVIAAVRFGAANDLPIAVRGGGHAVTGHAVCDGGIVIDMRGMKGMRVDPEAKTVWAQAGLTWGEFDHETQAFGLATTGGRMSETGIAGLTLGGGSGWLERKHGFTCDNLISVELVTGDGRLVRASEDENPELYFGLHGGGGNFGVATAFEYRLHEVGPIVYGGIMMFPAPRAPEVLRAYRDFIADAPGEVGGGCAFLTAPPEEFVPEEARGKQVLGVIVAYFGPVEEGEKAFAPIRELGPAVEMVQPMPYVAVQQLTDPGNPPGMQNYWKGDFVDELTDEAIDTLCEHAAKVPSPLTALLVLPMGGAIATPPRETPLIDRDAAFDIHYLSLWPDPGDTERNIDWTRETFTAMRPHATGGLYLNFTASEDEGLIRAAFREHTDRMVALKDEWDPQNLFRLNQNIKPSQPAMSPQIA
jgi:hypothetical protein